MIFTCQRCGTEWSGANDGQYICPKCGEHLIHIGEFPYLFLFLWVSLMLVLLVLLFCR